MNNIRAQTTTGAAVLIIIIGLILVVYVMSLPPADREALLEQGVVPGNQGTGSTSELGRLTQRGIETSFQFPGPGSVGVHENERIYSLPSVQLRTRTSSQVLLQEPIVHLVESFREQKTHVTSFLVDVDNTNDVLFTFLAKKHVGVLTITLNNRVIFQDRLQGQNIAPIRIPSSLLSKTNILEFQLDSVGLLFWRKNEYILEDVKIFGSVTDTTEQRSYVSFEVLESELTQLQRAVLDYYPSCVQTDVSVLRIFVNDRLLLSQVPDCNMLNRIDVPFSMLKSSVNTLSFETERDSYLIDRISMRLDLKDSAELLYFFDLSSELFLTTSTAKAVCGEIDGVCPEGCSASNDRDCCFKEFSSTSYWCDVPTSVRELRCVGRVDESNVHFCPTGYRDRFGNPHPDFKGICGDNTDGVCPEGCLSHQDKDCCFANNSGNFWCPDLPIGGAEYRCLSSVTIDQRSLCPSGYRSRTTTLPNEYASRNPVSTEEQLRPALFAEVTLTFTDSSERKRGLISVNGRRMSFSTFDDSITRSISEYVRDGTNYVQVIPESSFTLVDVRVAVKER